MKSAGRRASAARRLVSPAMAGLLCVLVLFAVPLSLQAAQLTSLKASSQGSSGETLVSLRFTEAAGIILGNSEGRAISVIGATLPEQGVDSRAAGYFKTVRATAQGFDIVATRYVSARLVAAGAGNYLLFLSKAQEPAPPPKPAVAEPTYTPPESKQNPASSGPAKPLQKPDEPNAGTPLGESRSARAKGGEYAGENMPPAVQTAGRIAATGDTSRALILLQSILPGERDYGWSRILMGELYEASGSYSQALDYYREALVDTATESVAAVHIALAFQAMGNPDAATGMWERVLELGEGQLVEPPRPSANARLASTSPSAAAKTAEMGGDEAKGRPIWLTVVLAIVILGLLAGIIYGGYRMYGVLTKRRGVEGSDFDLDDGLMAEMGLEDSDSETVPSGAGKIAKQYQQQSGPANPGGGGANPGLEDTFSDDSAPAGDLSDPKRKKVEALYRQGSTVREIAETLGIGQDEVRMVINLAGEPGV